MYMSYPDTIYYVNEFICICIFIFASFVSVCLFCLFFSFQVGMFLFIEFSYLLINFSPSEYEYLDNRTQVNAIYGSYVSILSLSGLRTACPDLVLIISCAVLSVLLLIVLGSSVTV